MVKLLAPCSSILAGSCPSLGSYHLRQSPEANALAMAELEKELQELCGGTLAATPATQQVHRAELPGSRRGTG